jgi:hypothetical protein
VAGRILIDIYGYNKHHLALKRREGKDKASQKKKVNRDIQISPFLNLPPMPPPPPPIQIISLDGIPIDGHSTEEIREDYYIKRLSDNDQKKNKDEMLARGEDLVFLSPMLMGYALKNKLWCRFSSRSM